MDQDNIQAKNNLGVFNQFQGVNQRCPSCGYCPTCGRSNQLRPYQPYPQDPTWNTLGPTCTGLK